MKKILFAILLAVNLFSYEKVIIDVPGKEPIEIEPYPYYVTCIEDYKWIQFYYIGYPGRGGKSSVVKVGEPKQLFKGSGRDDTTLTSPIPCKEFGKPSIW